MKKDHYQRKLLKLRREVEKRLADAPGCHDIDHTLRVRHNALLLAGLEPGADLRVVETAALLHDIARPAEMAAGGKICHAEQGAALAPAILRACGFRDEAFITAVTACIRRHRYRRGEAPVTIEEKIVYDADKLDSIGAIGVGRAFHFAGGIGAHVHNTKKQALGSSSYSREDSAYREYLVKLRHLPGKILTVAGRKIAADRAAFMHRFFIQLNREVFVREATDEIA